MSYCRSCGNKLIENNLSCNLCGYVENAPLQETSDSIESVNEISDVKRKRSVSKQQYLLFFGALGLLVGIFLLPQRVLENKIDMDGVANVSDSNSKKVNREQSDSRNSNAEFEGTAEVSNLPMVMDSATLILVEEMEADYRGEKDKGKKDKIAENLAKAYISISYFSKAAPLLKKIAESKQGKEEWFRAGKAFFDAFRQTEDKEIAGGYGELARSCYEKVLDLEPKNEEATMDMALTYVFGNAPMAGITLLKGILDENPEHEMSSFYLGVFSMQTGQYDKAVARFRKVLEINQANIEAHFYLAMSLQNSGQESEAVKILKDIQENNEAVHIKEMAQNYLDEISK